MFIIFALLRYAAAMPLMPIRRRCAAAAAADDVISMPRHALQRQRCCMPAMLMPCRCQLR